jgi:hypothetical protein
VPVWQRKLADDVVAVLSTEPSVESIWSVGSLGSATAQVDEWSDVDIAAVVDDYALNSWFPNVDWLAPIGRVWAISRSETPFRATTRVVFDDCRRLDVIFFAHRLGRPDLAGTEVWRRTEVWQQAEAGAPGTSPRSETEAGGPATGGPATGGPATGAAAIDPVAELINELRFVASLAVVKLARGDELIGLHLAIECARCCLVLGMLMRDAGLPSSLWSDLPGAIGVVPMPSDPGSSLRAIEASTALFETYLRRLSGDYQIDPGPLEQMIKQLRSQS